MKDNFTKAVNSEYSKGGDDSKMADVYNIMPLKLQNGDISLPCHIAFVIKKISGFESEKCVANIPLTTIIRIKCAGIENCEAVLEFLEKDLKCRVNEVEVKMKDICNKT